MNIIKYQVVYIMKCGFMDKNDEYVKYYRALVRVEDERGVNYQVVKCTSEFAESFTDLNRYGTPLLDLRGRLANFYLS